MTDNKRLASIRQLPCCQCFAPAPSDACHANWQHFGKGMGQKADDQYTIPLCRACHQAFDTYQELPRNEAFAWFLRKLHFVNAVLDEQKTPNQPIF